ncbi:MAG: nucleotidyltransferase family protein, partial [Bryobacteraceae bacterium]
TNENSEVIEIQVKNAGAATKWIWGAFRMPGSILKQLHEIWQERHDEYFGTLVNEYLARGGRAYGFKIGESYVDVGTLNGYREALRALDAHCGVNAG